MLAVRVTFSRSESNAISWLPSLSVPWISSRRDVLMLQGTPTSLLRQDVHRIAVGPLRVGDSRVGADRDAAGARFGVSDGRVAAAVSAPGARCSHVGSGGRGGV